MKKVLLAWIGMTDLKAAEGVPDVGLGPIAQAVVARPFDRVFLLSDHAKTVAASYAKWLQAQTTAKVAALPSPLSGPTEFGEIYRAAVQATEHALADAAGDRGNAEIALAFHLSPGTPAMAAVWIILGKTRFPAELLESSKKAGVRTASVPFDISAEFIPDLLRAPDQRLREAATAGSPEAPAFADIIHRSPVMKRLIDRARKVAPRNVPVLIEGPSGTGKEMLARALHQASPRRDRPFVPVNCGAIPPTLIESELFGHEKGAFTDARHTRKGYFEAAHEGTLFLDEIGELPALAQVKLLRVLQEGEVTRVGASHPLKVDVRLIAATNRTLSDEITSGRFREDLFYRLAVAILKLPPLRERTGDLTLLIDHLLAQVNREAASEPGYKEKKLSPGARNLLLGHPWPGNVRELVNTLRRAALWSEGPAMSGDDVRDALLPGRGGAGSGAQDVLGRPLGRDLKLPELLDEVARHYLRRAMDEAHGNKTKAAELVGLASYQTLTNWLARYEVKN